MTSTGPQPPPCHDDVCLTCSDQALPVRIRALIPGGLALVDTGTGPDSVPETVSVALVDAAVGDIVLVHAKEAIACLGPDAAWPQGFGPENRAAIPGPGR